MRFLIALIFGFNLLIADSISSFTADKTTARPSDVVNLDISYIATKRHELHFIAFKKDDGTELSANFSATDLRNIAYTIPDVDGEIKIVAKLVEDGIVIDSKEVIISSITTMKSCYELYLSGVTADGVYEIDPDGDGPIKKFNVYCDMTTNGGGWTLCARSYSNDWVKLQWGTKTSMYNFYACHLYANSLSVNKGLAILSTSTNQEIHTYDSPDFLNGGIFTSDKYVTMSIMKDNSVCNRGGINNYQIMFTSPSMLGQTGNCSCDSCSTSSYFVLLINKGNNNQGCTGNEQIVPFLAFPCGSYGNVSASFEIYVR